MRESPFSVGSCVSTPGFEFRFNKCRRDLREQFLKVIAPHQFFYYGTVINKDPNKLWGEGFKYKVPFYKYVAGLVFQNAKEFLNNAKVIIDGSGSKDFKKQFRWYLKKRINAPGQRIIREVKVQDSSKKNLLQLADMVTGAIHRSFGDKFDAHRYRPLISHREVYVQMWPK